MKSYKTENYIGNYLVNEGIITQEQLERALQHQRDNKEQGGKGLLGQTLIELHYCTEEDVAKALAKRAGVPYVSLQSYTIDETAAGLLPPEIVRRYQALPIGFEKNRLVVAMMQPSDIIAIDDLRILTGYDIQPVVVLDKDLKLAIDRFSGTDLGAMISQSSSFYSQLKTAVDQLANGEADVSQVEASQTTEEITTQDDGTERPAVQLANIIFNQAVRMGASDIHIEPQEKSMRIRFRIDGVLHQVMEPPRRLHPSLVTRIKVMANMDIAERRIPQDGRITMRIDGKTIDARVATLPTAFGEKVTMRLLDRSARLITLKELGFPEQQLARYHRIMKLPYGFILVTGPTGSGKSTTLYATLVQLNSIDKHIMTLEDPIERHLDGINQVQVNVKAGMTFASGLRAALRNDPDIIMVGEIRDHETARIAVESALTGHLVLSTLHTNDSAGAITRLADMGIEPYLTASSLVGVIAQRLIRVLCPDCKEKYRLTRNEILKSVPDFPIKPQEQYMDLYRAKGCMRCGNTGYRGRRGVYEFLIVTESIQKLILNRASSHEIQEKAIEEGMVTLRQDGLMKVRQGITTLEEVIRVIV